MATKIVAWFDPDDIVRSPGRAAIRLCKLVMLPAAVFTALSREVWKSVESATREFKKVTNALFENLTAAVAVARALILLEFVSISSNVSFNLVNSGAELSSVSKNLLLILPKWSLTSLFFSDAVKSI